MGQSSWLVAGIVPGIERQPLKKIGPDEEELLRLLHRWRMEAGSRWFLARVLPFFDEHDVKLLRVLTDRGSEYCGNPERHEYELYLAVEDIDHSTNSTVSPSTRRYIVRSTSCRPIWIPGSRNTTAHHNTHLSMPLKRTGFADWDAIPRGILDLAARVR
jgi:hypothetical protein